jgi:hypothetical protein
MVAGAGIEAVQFSVPGGGPFLILGAETKGLPRTPARGPELASESSATIPLMESLPMNSATGRLSQSAGTQHDRIKAVKPSNERRPDMAMDEIQCLNHWMPWRRTVYHPVWVSTSHAVVASQTLARWFGPQISKMPPRGAASSSTAHCLRVYAVMQHGSLSHVPSYYMVTLVLGQRPVSGGEKEAWYFGLEAGGWGPQDPGLEPWRTSEKKHDQESRGCISLLQQSIWSDGRMSRRQALDISRAFQSSLSLPSSQ